jgi:glyoxylase-like metal-dependent hydrolase (beta-lactamase superfamily II)
MLVAICFLALTLLAGSVTVDAGRRTPSTSEQSHLTAYALLEACATALGGRSVIESIGDVTIRMEGHSYERGQSWRPTEAYHVAPFSGTLIVDLRAGKAMSDTTNHWLGGLPWHRRTVLARDAESFSADFSENARALYPLAVPSAAAIEQMGYVFPALLIRAALRRPPTLRWMGQSKFEGRRHDVIVFADSSGTQFNIWVDTITKLPTKYEELRNDTLAGDSLREIFFKDYRRLGDLVVPKKRIHRINGETVLELTNAEVLWNARPSREYFAKPDGLRETRQRLEPSIKELASDVYLVEGLSGYRSMVVAFRDFLLVVEAPLNSTVADAAIAKIKETLPGKPIKYLVLTHYHFDHSGGTRAFIAEGTTVITAPGNLLFLREMAASPRTFAPDRLSQRPTRLEAETVEAVRVISDGNRRVEVHNIGANPHCAEILVIYVPHAKLLFQADLAEVVTEGRRPLAHAGARHLLDTLTKLKLDVTTIAGVHGIPYPAEVFLEAVQSLNPSAMRLP